MRTTFDDGMNILPERLSTIKWTFPEDDIRQWNEHFTWLNFKKWNELLTTTTSDDETNISQDGFWWCNEHSTRTTFDEAMNLSHKRLLRMKWARGSWRVALERWIVDGKNIVFWWWTFCCSLPLAFSWA